MRIERVPAEDLRVRSALEELQGLIQARYPEATFTVSRAVDAPEITQLMATVDVDDLDDVVDLVIERELELQVEQGLPIHVIPVRPLQRVLELRRANAQRRPSALEASAPPAAPRVP
jgi:hypothetical protein